MKGYIYNRARIAVYFDLENLKIEELLTPIINKFIKDGFIVFPRKLIVNNISQVKKSFLDKNVKPNQLDLVISYADVGKNAADFRLYIEALDLLYHSDENQAFCIVSGDADYGELVIKLRNENRYVIGIGPKEKSKEEYTSLFNEFIYIEDLKPKPVIIEKTIEPKKVTKKTKELRKDKSFYNKLLDATNKIFVKKENSKLDEVYCSNIIKDLKDNSLDYFSKFKITSKDFQKIGLDILYKDESKPETAYLRLSNNSLKWELFFFF